jgi:xylitol oxidase
VKNWAGNVEFAAERFVQPRSLDELRRALATERSVHVLGAGHSFSEVADSPGMLLSLSALPGRVEIDPERGEVTLPAGLRLEEGCRTLAAAGWALPSLPSLLGVSVGGAVATGTHGSGDSVPSLSALVSGLEWIGADGDVHSADVGSRREGGVSESGSASVGEARVPESALDPSGFVVSLGAFGVVTRLRLRIVPAFTVAQTVYEGLPETEVAGRLDEALASAEGVSLFTRWKTDRSLALWLQCWTGSAGARGDQDALSAPWEPYRAKGPRHPIPELPADRCTPQLGLEGPWHERLPHFLPAAVPSVGAEVQSEYFLDRERASEAAFALLRLGSKNPSPLDGVLAISEVRSVAADALWLSPAYGRRSVAFHFTWFPEGAAIERAIDSVEQVLVPLGARPHWGKVFRMDPGTVRAAFPRLADAARLRLQIDPDGVFHNPFSRRYLEP